MKKLKVEKAFKELLGIVVLAMLAFSFNSCEQFDIEENPAASELQVVTYSSMAQLELGVTGIYGKLNKAAWMSTFYVNGWSGDDITTHVASNKADFREYDQRFITPENSRTQTNWNGVYEMIRAANTVLQSVEGVTLSDSDASKQDRLIGETYFLRGIMFNHLMRIHGRIPLVLEIDPFQQPSLASQLEVFEQIESDLLEAESRLPVKSPFAGSTTPSQGTVRAFLARLYMDWAGFPLKDASKYAQAAASAKSVIDNAAAHGFGLEPDLAKLWSLAGRFSQEGVFTIAYSNSAGNLTNRKMGKLGLPSDPGLNGWQETFAEIRFFEDMPEGTRKDATYYAELPVGDDGAINLDNPTKILKWEEFKDQQSPILRKIVGDLADGDWAQFQTLRSDLYMRYAEVLLIYAEASGEAGSSGADAWEALNMVHRRAEGLDINTPDPSDLTAGDGSIQDLAFTERKWEFAGEFIRWNDLVRKEKVQEALGARNPQVSIGTSYDENGVGSPKPLTTAQNPILGSLATDNYYAPIPQQEIEKNPNLSN
ncbi:RagB/SusD family nutrient uptake outer membrane protein [Zobellia barbeyronii]|uniref:RagB/SusD family nutrient uptake outer membrane protein n=1 Tax=Zobellia barbeyronii TaxID=2748009 RepID=A0ABS5WBX0_9FLAO|nr:RagB/SusD family nutrient uptake outer membrane protein [Zobellia barbeyronii]MBT2160898.1 RagB/SusD family nutrient uptake outer membrane protein [Zobellia barbeyronii]